MGAILHQLAVLSMMSWLAYCTSMLLSLAKLASLLASLTPFLRMQWLKVWQLHKINVKINRGEWGGLELTACVPTHNRRLACSAWWIHYNVVDIVAKW